MPAARLVRGHQASGLQRLLHEGVAEAHPMLAPGELVGVVTISATSEGKSANAVITVSAVAVNSVAITQTAVGCGLGLLLAGKLGEGVLKVLTDPEAGLFPREREIRFDC